MRKRIVGTICMGVVVRGEAPRLAGSLRDYCLCRLRETGWADVGRLALSAEVFRAGPSCEVAEARLASSEPPQVTIVVMAYLPSLNWRLEKLVCAYARSYVVVRKVLIVWNGSPNEAPNATCAVDWWRRGRIARASLESGRGSTHRRVELEVVAEEENTLLNRYRHSSRISTMTVVLQDDDVVHSPAALRAFAWLHRAAPRQILGVPPERDYEHRPDSPDKYRYAYVFHPRGGPYSFLLGQTSILAAHYLDDFLARAPRPSLAYIGVHKPTCEDLTLHFFVANETGLPPAVFHDLTPRQVSGGKMAQMHTSVSKRAWNNRRERCLDRLVKDFGGVMPLVRSSCRLAGNFSVRRDPILAAAYRHRHGFAVGDDAAPPPMRRGRRRRNKNAAKAAAAAGVVDGFHHFVPPFPAEEGGAL